MKIMYEVEPIAAVTTIDRIVDHRIDEIKPSLWRFLGLPVGKQLEAIAYRFLEKRGKIRIYNYSKATIGYKTLETDDLHKTIEKHAIHFYNTFGRKPAAILMGHDCHNQLLNCPAIAYQMTYNYGLQGKIMVAGITVILSPHLKGWFLMPAIEVDKILNAR